MAKSAAKHIDMPLGIVVRKTPGVTRWARWNWSVVAVLPGAGPAHWAELRREGDAVEYHAATLPLTLWAADTEAYLANLSDRIPSIYVVLRDDTEDGAPLDAVLVTASPYEAQDYADTGDELVEKVPMTEGLIAWVRDYARRQPSGRRSSSSVAATRNASIWSKTASAMRASARLSDVYRAPPGAQGGAAMSERTRFLVTPQGRRAGRGRGRDPRALTQRALRPESARARRERTMPRSWPNWTCPIRTR